MNGWLYLEVCAQQLRYNAATSDSFAIPYTGSLGSKTGLFLVPRIVRHPYEKDPHKDPNAENYHVYRPSGSVCAQVDGILAGHVLILRDTGLAFLGPELSFLHRASGT